MFSPFLISMLSCLRCSELWSHRSVRTIKLNSARLHWAKPFQFERVTEIPDQKPADRVIFANLVEKWSCCNRLSAISFQAIRAWFGANWILTKYIMTGGKIIDTAPKSAMKIVTLVFSLIFSTPCAINYAVKSLPIYACQLVTCITRYSEVTCPKPREIWTLFVNHIYPLFHPKLNLYELDGTCSKIRN